MTIHHTIVKGAAKAGVILTQEGDDVIAHHTARNLKVAYSTQDDEPAAINDLAKDAWNDVLEAVAYGAEHPGVRIGWEDGDWTAHSTTGDKVEIARDPILVDLFETLADPDNDNIGEDDEAEEGGGSVVPAKYKQMYAERGDATTCGDWLALKLNELCHVMDGKKKVTDYDRVENIAVANGVTVDRVDRLGTATNGWQGRYRMTVRNMLTPLVAAKGFLFVPEGCGVKADTELKAPKQWCAEHSPKAAVKEAGNGATKAKGGKQAVKA